MKTPDEKHPSEMPDAVLHSLGFVRVPSPYSDGDGWTHLRGDGKMYFHILTPDQVAQALVEVGHGEMRRAAHSAISSIDMDHSVPCDE